MVTTREMSMEIGIHLVTQVLKELATSPTYKAFDNEGVISLHDMLLVKPEEIETFEYPDDIGTQPSLKLSKKEKRVTKHFMLFV